MPLARTNLPPEEQVRNITVYNDQIASPPLESADGLLGDLKRQARESVCRREGAAFAHRRVEEKLKRQGPVPRFSAKQPIASSGEDTQESSLWAVEQ